MKARWRSGRAAMGSQTQGRFRPEAALPVMKDVSKIPAFIAVLMAALCSGGSHAAPQQSGGARHIRAKEHYAMRDGLRIYLWEKYAAHLEASPASNGKVALLVH